jgi:oligogalacturonide transporter
MNTMVSVSYIAISAEISEDPKERDIANGAKMVVSQLASLICALIPLEIVKLFADEASGYRVMGMIFGLFFAVPFLLMFFFNKETVQVNKERKKLSLKDFTEPFRIRSFRNFAVMYLFSFLSMSVVSTIFAYVMKYYLHRSGELTYVLGTMLVIQTVSIPAVVFLAEKIGKPKSYRVFALIWVLGVFAQFLVTPSMPWIMIYIAAGLLGVGIGGCIVLVYLIYPDVAEIGEVKTGNRNAGSYSGIISFMRKFAGAISSYFVTLALQFSGYIKPVKQEVDGIIVNVEQQQPESLILALKLIVLVLPLIFVTAAFISSTRYRVDNDVLKKMGAFLKQKRGETAEKLLSVEDENALLDIL